MSNKARRIPSCPGYRITRGGVIKSPEGHQLEYQYKRGDNGRRWGPYVRLQRDGRWTMLSVMRLVAEAFAVKPPRQAEMSRLKRDAILEVAHRGKDSFAIWCMANELSVQTGLTVMDSLEAIGSIGIMMVKEKDDGRLR